MAATASDSGCPSWSTPRKRATARTLPPLLSQSCPCPPRPLSLLGRPRSEAPSLSSWWHRRRTARRWWPASLIMREPLCYRLGCFPFICLHLASHAKIDGHRPQIYPPGAFCPRDFRMGCALLDMKSLFENSLYQFKNVLSSEKMTVVSYK